MSAHLRRVCTSLSRLMLAALAVSSVVVASAASTVEIEPFAKAQQMELARDVVVRVDGAGGAQVLWRDEIVAEIDLVLVGGSTDDPLAWSEYELSVRAGAHLPHPNLLDVTLIEGQTGGRRGPEEAGDDDLDGQVDEDPFDRRDNDGDGRIDEDFGTIGFRMRVSLAELDAAGLPGLLLRPRVYQWPYFHVDDIFFWDSSLLIPEDVAIGGAPAARFRAAAPLTMLDTNISPHFPMGRSAPRSVRMPYIQIEGDDGTRLYVGLLRLDGRAGELLPDESGIIWDAGSDVYWPLAILTAPTMDVLENDAGQALLTYGTPGSKTQWSVPPICVRCQRATIASVEFDLRDDGDHFLLHVEMDGVDPHATVSYEGLSIGESVPLARYLVYEGERRGSYRVPRESAAGRELLAAAGRESVEAEIMLVSGLTVRPDAVELTVDLSIADEIELLRLADEYEFPSHLSPDLLETWPNPFHETTTIRFRIPATLGEAFDFEETMATGLDLEAPAPFGPDPMVRVKVYNVSGQLVRMLEESIGRVGAHAVSWDGSDEQGRPVAAGAYYINVEVDEYTVTRRVLRLKP